MPRIKCWECGAARQPDYCLSCGDYDYDKESSEQGAARRHLGDAYDCCAYLGDPNEPSDLTDGMGADSLAFRDGERY